MTEIRKKNKGDLEYLKKCMNTANHFLGLAEQAVADGSPQSLFAARGHAWAARQRFDEAEKTVRKLGLKEDFLVYDVRDKVVLIELAGKDFSCDIKRVANLPHRTNSVLEKSINGQIQEANKKLAKSFELALTIRDKAKQDAALQMLDVERSRIIETLSSIQKDNPHLSDLAKFKFSQSLFQYRDEGRNPGLSAIDRLQAFCRSGIKGWFSHTSGGPLASLRENNKEHPHASHGLVKRPPSQGM